MTTTTVAALTSATRRTSSSWRPGSSSVGAVPALALPVVVGADDDDRQVGVRRGIDGIGQQVAPHRGERADVDAAHPGADRRVAHLDDEHVVAPGLHRHRRPPLRRGPCRRTSHRSGHRRCRNNVVPSTMIRAGATLSTPNFHSPETSGVNVAVSRTPNDGFAAPRPVGSLTHIRRIVPVVPVCNGAAAGSSRSAGSPKMSTVIAAVRRRFSSGKRRWIRQPGPVDHVDARCSEVRAERVERRRHARGRDVGTATAHDLAERRVGADDAPPGVDPASCNGSTGAPASGDSLRQQHHSLRRGAAHEADVVLVVASGLRARARRRAVHRSAPSARAPCERGRERRPRTRRRRRSRRSSCRPRWRVGPGISRSSPACTPSTVLCRPNQSLITSPSKPHSPRSTSASSGLSADHGPLMRL